MRRLLLSMAVTLTLVVACGEDGGQDDGPSDTTPADSGQTEPPPLTSCLDDPTGLPRPPGDQLPCELLPPGFGT